LHSLSALGWTPEWESAFQDLNHAGVEPARVLEEQKRLFRVGAAGGEHLAVLSGRLQEATARTVGRPAVGDWVAVEVASGRSRVHAVLPRRTALVRQAVFGRTVPQVVAANVDSVLIVTSLNSDFSPRRLERYLALVWESGARPVVVLNKADLCADVARRAAEAGAVAPGVPVVALSARTGDGLDGLAPYVGRGETTALVGSSGVGKSSLVNRLAGETLQVVREIRVRDDRGQHTTTSRQLLRLPGGALLIDTPGLRELALWDAGEGLGATFRDIEEIAARCRFRDCSHDGEPGCAVRNALRTGALDAERYLGYEKLRREQAHLERKQDERAALDAKRRWKRMTMANRRRPQRGFR